MTNYLDNARRTLIGRSKEVEVVRAAVDGAVRGEGQALLVTGEPGIGKTRLLSEAATLALDAGARVLVGTAVEGGGMPAFYPLYDALRPLVRELETDGSYADSLAVLAEAGVASLRRRLEAPPALSPEAQRLRLFDTVLELLTHDDRPVLLALDDLQWADPATWQLVAFIARALPRLPLLLLLAARPEVLEATDGAAASALAELGHQRRLRQLQLTRLDSEEVQSLALQVVGAGLDDRLAIRLYELSEGNPFYVEEVLQSLRENEQIELKDDVWVPTSTYLQSPRFHASLTLRLAIGSRLDRLPPDCLDALRSAAVLGRRVARPLLARMLSCDAAALDATVRPAVRTGLLRLDDDIYIFSHDTIRQTIYDGTGSRVVALHAQAAATLASPDAAIDLERAGQAAQHWRLGGRPLEASEAAATAAKLARVAHSYDEALAFARQAVEQARLAGPAGVPSERLRELLLLYGELALTATEFDEAEAALKQAADSAAAEQETSTQAQAWRLLGALYRRREVPDQAAAYFHEAVAALESLGESEAVAETLIEIAGLEGLTRARYDEAESCALRATEIARELGSARLEAAAALALAGSRGRGVGPDAARPLLVTALEKAIAAGDPALASEVCANLSNIHYWSGEMQAALTYAERRLALAEEARDVFAMRHAHTWLALVCASLGRFERARDLLAAAEPGLQRLQSPEPIGFLRIVAAFIDYMAGDIESAYAATKEAIMLFERVDPNTLVWYEGLFVLVCIAAEREAEARSRITALEGRLRDLPENALPARSARTALGRAYAELGDREAGAVCERALRPYPNDYHWSGARHTLAGLALLRGDVATAVDDLASIETHARAQQLLPDVALALLRRAEIAHMQGDVPQTDECRAMLESLGMRRWLARLDAVAVPLPALAATTPVAVSVSAPAGLTGRELEVLKLLAQGLTNAEIAGRLVLSERTVINHLSHVFGKIGVANRAGAVAYAHRNGLA